jgi:two-component system nitrogen regulation sensor histidine kinase GlnL
MLSGKFMQQRANALQWCGDGETGSKLVREPTKLLDSLFTGVLLFDAELCLLYLNSAAEALLSVSARKAIGQSVQSLVPEIPQELVDGLTRALQTGQPYAEREVTVQHPGMESITLDCIITPLLEGDVNASLLLELVSVDRLHRIARDENMVAQHNMASALVHGMAHEVKNPLGGIRGAAQLLERELPSEAQREYTRIIIGECDRLRKLIDRILLPERVSHKQQINIHEVVEHVRALVQAEATGLRITRDYDPSVPDVYVDRDQMIQAVLNVVRNAVQALHGGGEIILRTRVERQVTIAGKRHRLAARLDISDDGPGIPADIVDQIFYPMVTGRPDGTGLGLSITRTLVQRQGGIIAFESRAGRTTFSIWLPAGTHDEN